MLQARGKQKRSAAAPTAVVHRRAALVGFIAVAVALAGVAAVAHGGSASAASKRPAPPPATAALSPDTALDQDLSATLPAVNVNEAPGDYLGEGHDQVASALPPNLEIRDNQKFGSDAVHDTPTDLRTTPNDGFSLFDPPVSESITPWQDGNYADVGAQWPLTSAKVAASASNIYMAGATWDDNAGDPTHNGYQLHLYKLAHDGSCASAGCAEQTLTLPSIFGDNQRLIVATSLAVGVVGGRTLIAVGLSDFGIFIYDEDFNQVAQITDMAVSSGGQTPPNALAFGPPTGPGEGGLLIAGVVSPGLTLFSWELDQHGHEKSLTRAGGFGGVASNYATAAAVAQIGGHQYSVFGTVGGDVFVVDPDCESSPCDKVAFTQIGGLGPAVTGLTAVRSWDDDAGNQHLVVGLEDGTAEVLKYDGTGLKPIPIGANGETRVSWDQARAWFPGYGAGRLQVANDTAGPVSVSMASSPDSLKGCWLQDSVSAGPSVGLAPPLSAWPAVPAFPTAATPVPAGQSSAEFFIGALTAGVDGSCASAQAQKKGERAAYVVIAPAGDPADRRLVKLRVDQFGVVRIDSQVGGDLNAALESAGAGGSWGGWRLRVSGPADPVAQAAPTVSGQRLTSASSAGCQPPQTPPVADDPCRPVYRFDVTGAQWGGLGGAGSGQVTARLPAMTAQGTVDGKNWTELGRLMPVTAPTLSTDGTSVTLGPASFFWQDGPGDAPLTAVRVVSGGQFSEPVTLAGLQAPPLDSSRQVQVGSLIVTPTDPSGKATPRANGVDQAPLALALSPNGNVGVIADNDPRYGLVYYRDQGTQGLITGLYTSGEYSDYVSVGPCRGAYPNDGLGRRLAGKRRGGPGASAGACPAGSSPTRNYLVTTSAGTQLLTATLNDSGTSTGAATSNLGVVARSNNLSASGTATGTGVSVYGCAQNPTTICTLVDPTAGPALYQAGSATAGSATGLQFTVLAVTSTESLPLVVGVGHTLASAPLNVTPTQAKLQNTSVGFASTDMIDTYLVSSGEQVSATVPVGGAGAGRGRPRPR